ncbi:Cof-type HAD-IIB family hydrolase [Bacillus testis]|uniref:Cof-type HAD-IIB family hydrolase n=1 Tax=Bacillus testis TaxID=1622072 RepID=UPI00067F3AAF|nr:Cof-type HAD-IIB family hydrolase [Bacillus testis]
MKCLSIDLDGTLLNSKHELSAGNLEAIKELKEKGYYLILNTGRAYKDVIKYDAVKQLNVPIFCINGSVLYNAAGEIMYEASLSIDEYKKLFATLKGFDVRILVYTNHGGFPSTLPPLHDMDEGELDRFFKAYNYDEILEQENLTIYKLIALVRNEQVELIDEVKKALSENTAISMASSFPNNVEITSSEAHKGKAILRYQDMMNLQFEEIYAFGDGGNDLAQFEVATKSVAMANAPISIQEKADLITKTNDEDGFAYSVRHQLHLI